MRDLRAKVVVDSKSAPNLKYPIKPFDFLQVTMAKLQLALSTSR